MENKKYKLSKLFFTFWLFLVTSQLYAVTSISSDTINNLEKKWYVISNQYNDYTSCDTKKLEYDNVYPGFERSTCFENSGNYYYFICENWLTCDLWINIISTTSNTNNTVTNQINNSNNPYTNAINADLLNKLNKIINDLRARKDVLSKDDYNKLYNGFKSKLEWLKTKYSNNKVIVDMINYLLFELKSIQYNETDEVDNFLCELTWTCTTNINQSTNTWTWNNSQSNTQNNSSNSNTQTNNTDTNNTSNSGTTDNTSNSTDTNNTNCSTNQFYIYKNWMPANPISLEKKYLFKWNWAKNWAITILQSVSDIWFTWKFVCEKWQYKLSCPPNSFSPCIPSLYETNWTNTVSQSYKPTYLFRTYNNLTGKHYLKSSTTKDFWSIVTHNWEKVEWSAYISDTNITWTRAVYFSSKWAEWYISFTNNWNLIWYAWTSAWDWRIAVYNCLAWTNDYFMSHDKSCEWQKTVDTNVFYMYPNVQTISSSTIWSGNVEYPEVFDKNIKYKWNLDLNIKLPKRTWKVPVYVDVHGWWWAIWDKDIIFNNDFKWVSDSIINSWYWIVSINYTLSTTQIAWSNTVYNEIDCALQWIEKNKDKYQLDTDNIAIWWGSAGWHLAMQYSLNQSRYKDTSCESNSNTPTVTKVIPVSGWYDISIDWLPSTLTNVNELVNNFLWMKSNAERIWSQKAKDNSPIYNLGSSESKSKKYLMIYSKNDDVLSYEKQWLPMYDKMLEYWYDISLHDTWMTKHDWYHWDWVIEAITSFLKNGTKIVPKTINSNTWCIPTFWNFCTTNTLPAVSATVYVTLKNNITITANTQLPKENITFCIEWWTCSKLDNTWKPYYIFGINKPAWYQTTLNWVLPWKYVWYFKYVDKNWSLWQSNKIESTIESSLSWNTSVNWQNIYVSFSATEWLTPKFYYNYNWWAFNIVNSWWTTTKSNWIITYTQTFKDLPAWIYNSYIMNWNEKLTLNSTTIQAYIAWNASVSWNTVYVSYTVSDWTQAIFYYNYNWWSYAAATTWWTTNKSNWKTTYTQAFKDLPTWVYSWYIKSWSTTININTVTVR